VTRTCQTAEIRVWMLSGQRVSVHNLGRTLLQRRSRSLRIEPVPLPEVWLRMKVVSSRAEVVLLQWCCEVLGTVGDTPPWRPQHPLCQLNNVVGLHTYKSVTVVKDVSSC